MSALTIEKSRLLNELAHLDDEPLPWEIQEFSHFDFTPVHLEQSIIFYKLAKITGIDPIIFWLKTRQHQQFAPYLPADIEKATPKEITVEECSKKIAWCIQSFNYPDRITFDGDIRRAFWMMALWNDESFLIETDQSYYVFFWGTSA